MRTKLVFNDVVNGVGGVFAYFELHFHSLLPTDDDPAGGRKMGWEDQASVAGEGALRALRSAIELGRLTVILDVHTWREHQGVL